ncbi:hypothetical protein ACTMSW_29975 [Micromonospora sp. BQ11]|uniref:hypothetical protein n=1 Tax=Micromonospora sp. BQ11 TaxID=3452212 RepID=UPI003F8B7FF2
MTFDEDRFGVLLRDLDAAPPRNTRVDLGRAVRDGRRRRRNRRWTVAGAAAVTTLAVAGAVPVVLDSRREPPAPAAVTPPTSCEVSTLPMPPGTTSVSVLGADPGGRYLVGAAWRAGSGRVAVLWDGDRVVDLPDTLKGGYLQAVNSAGTAIGGVDAVPYVYRDGRVERLPGTEVQAKLINDAGTVAGERYSVRDGQAIPVPVRWRSPSSAPEDLPLPGPGWSGEVTGLDEDGTMVGTVSDGFAPSTYRGYLWRPDGTGEFLPLPMTPQGRASAFWPAAVREGSVVGTVRRAVPGSMETSVMRLDLRTAEFVPLPGPTNPQTGVANGRWAVVPLDNLVGAARWALLTEAGTVELPEPDEGRDQRDPAVTAISDDGRMLAGTHIERPRDDMVQVPVRWRCR